MKNLENTITKHGFVFVDETDAEITFAQIYQDLGLEVELTIFPLSATHGKFEFEVNAEGGIHYHELQTFSTLAGALDYIKQLKKLEEQL